MSNPIRMHFNFGIGSYWHLYLDEAGPPLIFNWKMDKEYPGRERAFINGATPCPACGGMVPHFAHRMFRAADRAEVGIVCWSSTPFAPAADIAEADAGHEPPVSLFQPKVRVQ